MRGGVRKTIALETREENDAIRMALELANGSGLAIGGTLEGEIEAFISFKLARNEFSRFSAENKRLTLRRFARWVGRRTPIPSIKTSDLQRFYGEERGRVTESTAQGYIGLHDVLALVFHVASKGTKHNRHESGDWHQHGTVGLRDESRVLPAGASRCPAGRLAKDGGQNYAERPGPHDWLYHACRI
jgi:hypothetical protein